MLQCDTSYFINPDLEMDIHLLLIIVSDLEMDIHLLLIFVSDLEMDIHLLLIFVYICIALPVGICTVHQKK